MTQRVAVIGLAFRFPGTTPQQYWSDLLGARHLISEVDPGRWSLTNYVHPDKKHPGTAYTRAAGSLGEIDGFDADFFGISPREAALMDPQQRILLELCWETIESAGLSPARLRGSDCGVYVGIASTDYAWRIVEDLDVVEASVTTGNAASIAANRLSYVYDLRGPSIALDTACSSAMVAFHQACRAIATRECPLAIAGGVNLHLHPYGFIGFSKAGMLSRRGRCSVFDAQADGYVRAEGAGLFLLKDYDQALADGDPILAVVAASAVNTDGRKSGLTVPCAQAQMTLMRKACAQAGLTPADIDYLEAHGTGTPVGDPIESYAIGMALGQPRGAGNPLPIGSVKANMGHLETASGVAGLVKAIYALRHRVVPATIGVNTVNPNIQPDEWNIDIVTANRPLRPTGRLVIGVNSFGFGGANAHVILTSPPEPETPASDVVPAPAALPLVLTGKTPAAVRDFAASLAAQFADVPHEQSPQYFYDVAYQLARRRQWHGERTVVFASSSEDACTRLRAVADGRVPAYLLAAGSVMETAADNADHATPQKTQQYGPVFVYSGNGSQWAGMGAGLLTDPVFAAAVADVDTWFVPLAGFSLADELAGKNGVNDENRYARTEIAQPALFALQVGMTCMLARHGVTPAAVMGHSVGEVAAAWACGALSLADAVQVIYHRSRLQGLTKGGGQMSAVGLGGPATQAVLETLGLTAQLTVAGVNSASGATVAGAPAALSVLETHLAERQIFFRRLDLDYAFHSPSMDAIESDVQQALADITPRSGDTPSGRIPFYSTVTGTVLDGAQLNANYWWRNIRLPVQFADAGRALLADGHHVFVEVGPHPVLRGYLNDLLKCAAGQDKPQGRVIVTVSRKGDEPERILTAAGQVIASGAHIHWDAVFPKPGRHAELPAYAWQRERHWHPVSPDSQGLLMRECVHPLLGYALPQHDNTWQNQLDTQLHPTLADHVVGDAVVFPGAGFVELALAAAWQWQGGERERACVEIEELDIRAPLLLAASPSKIVRVVLDAGDGRLHIKAKAHGAQADWTLHASARVTPAPSAALLARPALSVPAAAPDFSGADHMALTSRVGLHYGPAFQAVAHGWRTAADTVVAALTPHDSLAADLAQMHLHPALLDSAFQLIVHLLEDDPAMGQGIAFVPIKIGRLALWIHPNSQTSPQANPPRYVQVRLRRRAPRSLTADVVLCDAHGERLAVAEQVRFRAVRLRQQADERLNFLRFVATPRPLAGTPAVMDAALLRQSLVPAWAQAQSARRFNHEVQPLLEALCDRYAVDALTSAAAEDGVLDAAALQSLSVHAPERAALLQHMLGRAIASGHAQATESGWQVSNADTVSAADIWNTLLREYPDYFPVTQAVGRVGLSLPALLQEKNSLEATRPSALTPAALATLARGPALTQQLSASVVAAVLAAQQRLSPGQRLSVLEVGGDAPWLSVACANALDISLADVRYVTPDAAIAEQAQRRASDSRLNISVDVMTDTDDANAMVEAVAGKRACHDFAILHGAFDTLTAAQTALAWTVRRLKPGGVLLLLGRTPAPWVDFLFGAWALWRPDAKGGAAPGHPYAIQQGLQDWQACVQALGLQVDEQMQCGGDEDAGSYALIAKLPASAAADITPVESVPHAARSIVLLADAQGASADLAHALQDRLSAEGHRCHIVQDVDADHLDGVLHTAREQLGELHDIVHLHGWGAAHAHMSAETLTQAQVRRCALAATLMQACVRDKLTATLWLLTSGATSSMRIDAQADSHLCTLNDAALWGYGRTLANEADAVNCRVRLLDLPVDAQAHAPLLAALAQEFSHPDAEDEILLDATGARAAPRLRELARPHATSAHTQAQTQEARLGFEFPGQLRHLRWEACSSCAPADYALQVRVHATGLNFRDVMYTLGMLSDEAVENGFVGPTLGLEFAGVVTQVGRKVTDYQPGDAVVGFGPASFSTTTLTQSATVAHIPQGFSFEAAATLPSAFFTVYYALHHLARLQAGEKILIHGAAGGVGIAAIQYAQYCGAEIYATAGSDEKRDFLRLMGVRHIYDSRTLTYADDILADTDDGHGNAGVDVVLNSLAGEAIHRNFRVLKPFGRFLELGKRDFYENTPIGLRPFRNNISYFGIDADQLMRERPDLTCRLFGELMDLFAQRHLHPLPYTAFDANEVVDAFRYMQQAQQIGKIVVTYRNGIKQIHDTASRAVPKKTLHLSSDASYLVTGGLAGFGLRTAQWLAEKGARSLILISRSGPKDEHAREAIAALAAQGVQVHAAACDVTDRAALAALLAHTAATLPPLKGIVHAAAVIDDALAVNASTAQIERNLAAKVLGARFLHELTQTAALDFCVYYSSATTLFGNPGQSAYVAANTWLEALAAQRRAQGLPATCVGWGPIDDVGFLARNERIKHALQDRMGGAALTSSVVLAALEDMLLTDASGVGVLELDWRALKRFLPGATAAKFADVARHVEDDGQSAGSADDIAQWLATLDDAALHARVVDVLQTELGDILRIVAAKIDPARSIYDMGLDSLMGVELVVALENRFGIRLPVMALNENATLDKLAQQLITLLRGEEADGAGEPEHVVTANTVAQIAANHAADVSQASIDELVTDIQRDGVNPQRWIH